MKTTTSSKKSSSDGGKALKSFSPADIKKQYRIGKLERKIDIGISTLPSGKNTTGKTHVAGN